jgi:hypothetical protein
MKFFKIFTIGAYALAWYERASQDGEITQKEVLELITGAFQAADLKIKIKL